jgi:hypothetical protein
VIDVNVNGRGFYSIDPASRRGRAWVKRKLSRGERTPTDHGGVWCDSGRATREIVAAMVADGLRVDVNGEVFAKETSA